MKKFLSVVMVMVLVFSMIPMNAFANGRGDIVDFTIEDTYVYDFQRGVDDKFDSYMIKYIVAFEDGSVEQSTMWAYSNSSVEFEYGSLVCSDNQETTRWEAGNIYQVSYGENKTFNVEVRKTPIVDMVIDDCNFCIFDTDSGKYIYQPSYTLYFTDGTYEKRDYGSFTLEYFGQNYDYFFEYTDTQDEEPWTLGNTYEVTGTLLGVSDTFNVTVVEVQDIEVEDMVYIEGAGSMTGYWDGDNYIEDAWMEYYVYPDSITVTFTDGSIMSGATYEIEEITGMWCWCESDQSFENQWGVGEHTATISLGGITREYTVEIVESPIASIEIEDISIMEGDNGYYEGENYIYHSPSVKAKVKLKDGTELPYNGSFEINDKWYWIEVDTSSQYENPWQAGNTYEVTGTLLGVSDTFNVTIEGSPIESIEVEDVTLIEYCDGYYSEEDFIYSIYSLKATVKLKNGDERDIYGGFSVDDTWYSINTNAWDMQNEEPWEVGNTYEVTGTLLGVFDTFNVTIVESPIESIVLEDIVLFEGIDSYSFSGFEEYSFSPVLSSVLLKDGTTADIDTEFPGYIEYDGVSYYISDNSWGMQNEEHWEVGRTYTVTGSLLGVSATFNVTIQENPIRDIEILQLPDKTEYLSSEWFNLKGASIRIQYKDDSYEDIVIEEEYTGCYWGAIWSQKLNRYDYISIPFDFTEVGRQNVELQLFGKTFEIPVTVKENLMESISIKENVDKTIIITVNNSDGTSYDMTLLDMYPADWGHDDVFGYVLFTDKGSFEAAIFSSEDSFAIGMGEFYSENVIKSNSLPGSEWFKAVKCFDNFCSSILPGNDNFMNFTGQVTEDNIDRVIGTAFYMGYSWDDEDVVWEGEYAIISGARIRKFLEKYFATENIDLTLSDSYDVQSDTYELFDYIRASWMKTRPIKINYSNGVWSMRVTYLNDDGVEMSTYLKLNDEQKIISYSVNVNGKQMPDAPEQPIVSSKTSNTVILKAHSDYEYSMDGITWQSSPVFNGLKSDTEYAFYQRLAETDIQYASPASDKLVVKTEKFYAGWRLEEVGWVYYENGVKVTNCWKKDSKGWCYLGVDGIMATNKWVKDSKGWCYVGSNGYAVTNCWKRDSIGWIWLDSNGSMTKNSWLKDGGKWYYLDSNGYMVSNSWRKDSKGWVYLGASGAMLTNAWCTDSHGWCYVGADGYAVTNCWKKDSVGWIWLNSNGSMTKNSWLQDGGKWYYLNANGYMVTGRHLIDGTWYSFNSSGAWIR